MQRVFAILFLFPVLLILGGCAHPLPRYEQPIPRAAVQKIRTTAYTHTESDHRRYSNLTALGTPLRSGPLVHSAAADWARWPCGTMFRIRATGEIYEVDDYGFALSGRNTIDLYKPTKREMHEWGVRRVTIEILKWGDPWVSYRKMIRVRSYRHIRRMMNEIKSFFRDGKAPPEPVCPMPPPPTCQPCKPAPKCPLKPAPKKSPASQSKSKKSHHSTS
jgi:3D (Asp-Asp-Asp) domain-containing protein